MLGRQGSATPRSARPCTLCAVVPMIENRDGRLRRDELFGPNMFHENHPAPRLRTTAGHSRPRSPCPEVKTDNYSSVTFSAEATRSEKILDGSQSRSIYLWTEMIRYRPSVCRCQRSDFEIATRSIADLKDSGTMPRTTGLKLCSLRTQKP